MVITTRVLSLQSSSYNSLLTTWGAPVTFSEVAGSGAGETVNAIITINANTIPAAIGCLAAALGVGMVGAKAVESVGRNPEASGKILVQSILGMALAEAVAFYAIFLAK